MTKNNIFSVCGMCSVRCPIMAEVENDRCLRIQGNPHAPGVAGSLCARGAAGVALTDDHERPQSPLIREGARGEGKWRKVSWDEALDYVAGRLNEVRSQYGDHSLLWSDRGGPFIDLNQAFMRAMKSPNYNNHDASCARNVQHAALSLFGFGRKSLVYDLKNANHVILQTRNIFEGINVKEVNDLLDAMDNGCKLTVIDTRATVTACKADNFFMIRPGTDYAFNLAVINVLLKLNLYDREFAAGWINDLEALHAFVSTCTPEWAEKETGVAAEKIVDFAEQLVQAAPAVIWHPGWMTARYKDSFYVCRTAYIINALLGAIGAKGGLPMSNSPSDIGRKGLKKFADLYPKPDRKRADLTDTALSRFDPGPGLVHLSFKAIETGEPYPLKAYIAWRHDPLMALPDPEAQEKILNELELLVSVTFTWSDTAWFSDVVLPLSPYLERESILASKNGLKPSFFLRNRAVSPRFDTRADWEIITGLAKRLNLDKLCFNSIDEIRDFQLQGTGVTMRDFQATGSVSLCEKAMYREPKFKTPSGKIEIISKRLEAESIPSLKPYQSPSSPPEGLFRLTFGRCGVHTQGHTVNNPLLNEQVGENVLWINAEAAARLNIASGDAVEVSTPKQSYQIKAFVTEFIHPEAVFMLHGFGHTLEVESRALNKGAADNKLMSGGLEIWDQAGGGLALQEHFVRVRKTG